MTDYKELRKEFDDNFLWGASIAMYQTDGADNSQWAVWERKNADRLAKQFGPGYEQVVNHEEFIEEGKDPENYIAKDGIRHRENFKSDFDILQDLGFTGFRFSVEWSRIEPTPGEYIQEEIEYIRTYIRELKKRGITPTMTLWHFSYPQWFEDLGGFMNAKNIKYFENFSAYVLRELNEDIEYIFTINEPMIFTYIGYGVGEWPPAQKVSFMKQVKFTKNLAKAHNRVYKLAKEINPDFKISVAQNTASSLNGDNKLKTKWNIWFADFQRDYFFLGMTHKNMDYLGINWYNTDTYFADGVHNPNVKLNDLAWNMEPDKINIALERLYKKYQLPILITENGLADADDKDRLWWIQETLQSLVKAKNNGVKFVGYLHWSAFDNFEWDKGYWPRFGLIHVDRNEPGMPRTVRESAKWYSKFIKNEI
jgi:beta-glucosidase